MTKFPKIAGLTLTAVIVTGFFSVAAQKNRIVGTYLSCEMACQAIQIRADGTFQHLFDGDLYNNERTGGTWKLIGHNRIKAWSPEPLPPVITEKAGSGENVIFAVMDSQGATVPGATITLATKDGSISCSTDDTGSCRLHPSGYSFTVYVGRYSSEYQIKDRNSKVFEIVLPAKLLTPDVLNDIWVIERNTLYFEREGKIDRDYGLRRVNKSKALKLFPDKKSN